MNSQPEAFPLAWPVGYPRTSNYGRKRALFKATFGRAIEDILRELRLLKASYPIISTNQPLRRDGLPSASKTYMSDPGVAVYFLLKGQRRVIACDKWDKIEDNLRAVAVTIEAMRGMDRWGCSEMLDRVFQGFTALPAPSSENSVRDWWQVLGVSDNAPLSSIEAAYRLKIKASHPDVGGTHEEMTALNRAIAEARKAKGV